MSTEVGIWRVDQGEVQPTTLSGIDFEKQLEDIIVKDISVLGPRMMVIGRQVGTDTGKYIDVLAIDSDGNLIVVELKRSRTPREVVAQVLEYAEWVRRLTSEDIATTFDRFQKDVSGGSSPTGIDEALMTHFGAAPEELNNSHQLIVVAADMDTATERIVTYLQEEHGVPISVALFRAFQDEERQYLTRVWMNETDPSIAVSAPAKAWNGECYVSFSEGGERRAWSEAKQYGFISAGGGDFYTKTLKSLQPGERVWVKICELKDGNGYVGVGTVKATAVRSDEFRVLVEGAPTPIAEVSDGAKLEYGEGEEEWYVAVEWEKAVDLQDAVWRRGFFGNQNTVARPRASSWASTIEFLRRHWGTG